MPNKAENKKWMGLKLPHRVVPSSSQYSFISKLSIEGTSAREGKDCSYNIV